MSIRSLVAGGAGAVVVAVIAAGCSVSAGATLGPPAGCNPDSTVSCPGGGDGWDCDPGVNPEDEDSSLSCSIPQSFPDGTDGYCCFSWTYGTSSCTPDDTLVCDPYSYGYTCAAGDDPTSLDASLNCSEPTPDGPNDDFCCQ